MMKIISPTLLCSKASSLFFKRSYQYQSLYCFSKLYTKNHQWIQYSGESSKYKVGITNYAQQQLGQIVFVDMIALNKDVKDGSVVAVIQSVKTTADLNAPADGKVTTLNQQIVDHPDKINQNPLQTWIFQMVCERPPENLLTQNDYASLLKQSE